MFHYEMEDDIPPNENRIQGTALREPADPNKKQYLNEAVLLIKPHATKSPWFVKYVESRLNSNEIKIVERGEWTGEELWWTGMVAKHYGTLAQRALVDDPSTYKLDAQSRDNFSTVFDEEWETVVEQGRVCNYAEARKRFPNMNEVELENAWRRSRDKQTVRLMSGTYVAWIRGTYVINGFYGSMTASWMDSDAKLIYYVIQWNPERMTWVALKRGLVGALPEAKDCPVWSLRQTLYQNYKRIGLKEEPRGALNGVHVSAGPLEGAREMSIWTKGERSSILATYLKETHPVIFNDCWEKLLNNPLIGIKTGECRRIFEFTEEVESEHVLNFLKLHFLDIRAE